MTDAPTQPAPTERSNEFASRGHPRYWWHEGRGRGHTPPVYSDLADGEWALLREWFEDTERLGTCGEISVAMASVLQAFVMGSGLRSIVQLGHFRGYSTLLMGFWLRRMGVERGLVSIDCNQKSTEYTRGWIERAGLARCVTLLVGDSADPEMLGAAERALGRAPRCVIVDSSHQYAHTVRELDLWWGALAPGGMMFLHDCSEFARRWDRTGEGGVRRALEEWFARTPEARAIMLDGDPGESGASAYADRCGLCMVQKPMRAGPGD
ncbi:MAG TPA: class I SAM-dependent methyltransferase [Phycisphaerales bacterium]|nr:class I SAM-dependent methyltransferase [Phycisphaerales bacterium]